MREKKIKVPEGMSNAAMAKFFGDGLHRWIDNIHDQQCRLCGAIDCSSAGDCPCPGVGTYVVGLTLEAALLWLIENGHTLLNDVQLREMHDEWYRNEDHKDRHFYRWVVAESLRRMFLDPDPEVPEEIKNLIWNDWHKRERQELCESRPGIDLFDSHNAQVIEAYRRGLKKGQEK